MAAFIIFHAKCSHIDFDFDVSENPHFEPVAVYYLQLGHFKFQAHIAPICEVNAPPSDQSTEIKFITDFKHFSQNLFILDCWPTVC